MSTSRSVKEIHSKKSNKQTTAKVSIVKGKKETRKKKWLCKIKLLCC